jgi:hypothetical protein
MYKSLVYIVVVFLALLSGACNNDEYDGENAEVVNKLNKSWRLIEFITDGVVQDNSFTQNTLYFDTDGTGSSIYTYYGNTTMERFTWELNDSATQIRIKVEGELVQEWSDITLLDDENLWITNYTDEDEDDVIEVTLSKYSAD